MTQTRPPRGEPNYSPNGQRRNLTDANGNRAELRYDGHDRLSRWVFPSPTSVGALNEADYESYTWDAAGNRLTLRKRDGKTITFLYDNLNRMTRKTVPASASGAAGYSVFYGYDVGNRQTFARFGSTSPSQPGITSTYDTLGRLVSSSSNMGGTTRTLSYQVDAGGRRTRLTFPDGQYFAYDHSPAGELTAIRENGTTQVATFSYDAVSRPSAQAFPGASAAFQYDPISRLSNLNHDLAGTAADNAATFAYNPASQIVTRTLSNDAYAATAPAATSRSYAVNGLNQYTAVAGTAIGYDNNGNLSSDPGSASGTGGATGYVYDSENRLVSASGGTSATLIYDPMGRLFQTVGGGVTTRFLYDGDELVAEYDGAGTLLRRYVHGLGTDDPVLWYEGANLTNRRSLHRNHQGSIVAVADNNGVATAINAYDSWGLPNPGWTLTANGRFGFTGQIWLPELGMWHYKARLYSPTLGRFMQTDPVGYRDQINLYVYVGNDPVNRTDPSGRYECRGGRAQCDAVRQALRLVEAASRSRNLSRNERSLMRQVVRRMGREGEKNGIIVRFDTPRRIYDASRGAAYTEYQERSGESHIVLPTNFPTAYNNFRNDMAALGRRSSRLSRFSAEHERGNMMADESRHAYDQQRLGRQLRPGEAHAPPDLRSSVSRAFGTTSVQDINREED